MNLLNIFIAALLLFGSSQLQAAPLDDAIARGDLVELVTGYVAATPDTPARAKALADDINERRRAAYARIARKNGITIQQVAAESYRVRLGEPGQMPE